MFFRSRSSWICHILPQYPMLLFETMQLSCNLKQYHRKTCWFSLGMTRPQVGERFTTHSFFPSIRNHHSSPTRSATPYYEIFSPRIPLAWSVLLIGSQWDWLSGKVTKIRNVLAFPLCFGNPPEVGFEGWWFTVELLEKRWPNQPCVFFSNRCKLVYR